VDRGGPRLKLFKAQAEVGDIVLLFADESEALTHPYLARVWAKKGADLRVPAPGQAQKIAMMGSLDYAQRRLIVTTSRTKRSADFIAHLQTLDRLYGSRPGAPTKPVVLVFDNGPIHHSKASRAALAERAHWLTVEWLPKYAPELNDIEIVWGDLKARHLAHRTFTDLDSLDAAIHHAVVDLNSALNRDPLDSQRIFA
jgi:transposase